MQMLPGLALLIVAAVLAAGCSDTVPPSDTVTTDGDRTAPPSLAFLPARSVATIPNTQHEAFVAVSADGTTILTCAHGFLREPSHFFASTDGGVTFAELTVDEPMPGGGDCEVALSPAGVWAFSEKTVLGVSVVTSADGGATWTVNHLAAPPINGLADRQWLAYSGESLLLSYQPGSQQVGSVEVGRSADHGATWTLPAHAVLPDPAHPKVDVGPFLIGPDGSLRIPVARTDATFASRLSLAVSSDAGTSWSEQPVLELAASDSHPYPSGAAQGPDGRLTWAYAHAGSLVAISSSDAGNTWSEPITLEPGLEWDRPAAAVRPDGRVDVVWLSTGAQFGAASPVLALARVDWTTTPPTVETVALGDLGSIEFVDVGHDAMGRATVVATDAPKTTGNPLGTGELLVIQEALGEPVK